MAIISHFDPDRVAEAADAEDTQVREHCLTLLEDDDGLVQEALSETIGYDQRASRLLRNAVKADIEGRHPDLLPLGVAIVRLVSEYYMDVARTDYEGKYK